MFKFLTIFEAGKHQAAAAAGKQCRKADLTSHYFVSYQLTLTNKLSHKYEVISTPNSLTLYIHYASLKHK